MSEETTTTEQPQAAPVATADAAQVAAPAPTGTSGMGIASLVLGILAILTSFLPIINNGSFFLALLGLVFGVVGLVAASKGKKSGKGISIAGIVLNVLSVIIVLATQSLYGAAIDQAVKEVESGSAPVAVSSSTVTAQDGQESSAAATGAEAQDAAQSGDASADADYSSMALGQAVDFKDGMSVSVDAVITGLAKYDGTPVTGITVTYRNNGDKPQSFNGYDWKAETTGGVLDRQTYITDGENELGSGELTPGAAVTGNIYFEGELAKAHYYSNMFNPESQVAWVLQ